MPRSKRVSSGQTPQPAGEGRGPEWEGKGKGRERSLEKGWGRKIKGDKGKGLQELWVVSGVSLGLPGTGVMGTL